MADGCAEFDVRVDVAQGTHTVEVGSGARAVDGSETFTDFVSTFAVEEGAGVRSSPVMERPGLICNYLTELCHNAPGASWMRIKNLGGEWTQWLPYQRMTNWQAESRRAVLVQYHVEGSAGYIVGDCVVHRQERCHATFHGEMFLRTDSACGFLPVPLRSPFRSDPFRAACERRASVAPAAHQHHVSGARAVHERRASGGTLGDL